MRADFPYKNLHHYLDSVFEAMTPTTEQIISEKKKYWRMYHKFKKRSYRESRQEVTIAFTGEQIKAIQSYNISKLPLARVLKSFVLQRINSPVKNLDTTCLDLANQRLFLLIQLLEEIIEDKIAISPKTIDLLESHLLELEQLLQKL